MSEPYFIDMAGVAYQLRAASPTHKCGAWERANPRTKYTHLFRLNDRGEPGIRSMCGKNMGDRSVATGADELTCPRCRDAMGRVVAGVAGGVA